MSVLHRTPENTGDKVALALVKLARCVSQSHFCYIETDGYIIISWGFDLVSRYKYKPIPPNSKLSVAEMRKEGYLMAESEWLMVRRLII